MATLIFPNWFPSTSGVVSVNGNLVPGEPNFNDLLPAPPAGNTNVLWRTDAGGNISASALILDNATVLCEGVPVSDDWNFYCNGSDVSTNQVNSAFAPNGPPFFCNGVAVP